MLHAFLESEGTERRGHPPDERARELPCRLVGRATTAIALRYVVPLPLEERRTVPGLHPDRAPTIVAGTVVLTQVLEAFGLDRFEASERDILWGVAIDATPES